MIRSFDGKTPRIDPSAFIAETAYIIGDVEIGPGSSVWPGAVVRGDFASIRIGSGTHIEDNCVVHTGMPLEIGDNVTVGHGVVIHCSKVGSRSLIGNNATLLDGAEIGEGSIVAAGAVVTPRMVVPPGSFVAGVPGEIRGDISETSRGRQRGVQAGGRPGGGGYADLIRRYREQGLDANQPPS
jgi:carbonic anhydrase/acetyltransferase-like protein (isoleucine patch superfamily)